uniref:Uncharacterized protein n=1 Tax=viral metagenome TaxID=1070528 RepID=A0A6M3IEN1_9ZZZZ
MQEAPVTMRQWTAEERAMVEALPCPGPLSPYLLRHIDKILERTGDMRAGIYNPRWKMIIDIDAAEAWCWRLLGLHEARLGSPT